MLIKWLYKAYGMTYQFSVGIDVSKATIDVVVLDNTQAEVIHHGKFSNDETGAKQLLDWLGGIAGFEQQKAIFCMEATGLYCYTLTEQLQQNNIAVWIENSVQIKRSLGIIRGKDDKTDAFRIARYASKNQ